LISENYLNKTLDRPNDSDDNAGMSVPEPSSVILLSTAVSGLGLYGWRRRQKQ
jgi:hypothetical protein